MNDHDYEAVLNVLILSGTPKNKAKQMAKKISKKATKKTIQAQTPVSHAPTVPLSQTPVGNNNVAGGNYRDSIHKIHKDKPVNNVGHTVLDETKSTKQDEVRKTKKRGIIMTDI